MAKGVSRTYKLQLSRDGVWCFLECHHRLSRLACDFLPYGMTLYVAACLLDRMEDADIATELASAESVRLSGDIVRFVGFAPSLGEIMAKTALRLGQSAEMPGRPTFGQLASVGILAFRAAERRELALVYADAFDVKASAARRRST